MEKKQKGQYSEPNKLVTLFYVSMTNEATLKNDSLILKCTIHNTSGENIIISPSLVYIIGCTNINKSILFFRKDAMGVQIFGVTDTILPYSEMIEASIYYDSNYHFQFLTIESKSSINIIYKFPLKKVKKEILKEIRYYNMQSFPAWKSEEQIFRNIKAVPIQTKTAVFDAFREKLSDSSLTTGILTNIGMQNWIHSVQLTQNEFDKLKDAMTRCVDTTLQRFYAIKKY